MATLWLRLPRLLAQFCAGESRLGVEGSDVRSALDDAIRRHPLLGTHLFEEDGRVRPHLHVFLNDTDVREDLGALTHDGDEIAVLQAMSGGRP